MNLTVEQALLKGVTAHKHGRLQDAERLYQAIIKVQPNHPDANHNLGVLAISVNKFDAAVALFKTAVETNPAIEQFWLSYIDILVKVGKWNDAKQQIKKYRTLGYESDKINGLERRIRSDANVERVFFAIEEFYQNINVNVISSASDGWFFVDSFDRHFIDENDDRSTEPLRYKKVPTVNYTNHKQETTPHHDIKKVIKVLNNQESFVKKYNYIRTLIHNHDPTIVDDSFKNSKGKDLTNAIRDTFDNENLNMVIVGGGVCGLYPAYDIKSTLVKTPKFLF